MFSHPLVSLSYQVNEINKNRAGFLTTCSIKTLLYNIRLSLEHKVKANLVGGGRLVQTLGIDRSTEAKGDTRTEELIVSKRRNPLVVDLSLDERCRVELVLRGDLQTNTASISTLCVPCSLGTSLNLHIDFVVVTRREDVQIVCRSDGRGVLRDGVSDGSGVAGDAPAGNIVADLSTGEEAVVTKDNISVKGWALEKVEESAGVKKGLTVVEV